MGSVGRRWSAADNVESSTGDGLINVVVQADEMVFNGRQECSVTGKDFKNRGVNSASVHLVGESVDLVVRFSELVASVVQLELELVTLCFELTVVRSRKVRSSRRRHRVFRRSSGLASDLLGAAGSGVRNGGCDGHNAAACLSKLRLLI